MSFIPRGRILNTICTDGLTWGQVIRVTQAPEDSDTILDMTAAIYQEVLYLIWGGIYSWSSNELQVRVYQDLADSDGDNIGDQCDNCPSIHNPDQKDTNGNDIGDACECEGDFDNNLKVDSSDLAIFATEYGRTDCGTGVLCVADFNLNNAVDSSDLVVFLSDFGRIDCP